MKCQNCGATISKTASFCSKCGKPVNLDAETAAKKAHKKKERAISPKRVLSFAGIYVASLLVCGVISYFLVSAWNKGAQKPLTDEACIASFDLTVTSNEVAKTSVTTYTSKTPILPYLSSQYTSVKCTKQIALQLLDSAGNVVEENSVNLPKKIESSVSDTNAFTAFGDFNKTKKLGRGQYTIRALYGTKEFDSVNIVVN